MHTSILQVLKVNDPRTGTKDGRQWELHSAECIVLDESGNVDQVGWLRVDKSLVPKVKPGTYMGSFALRPNYKTRQIESLLVDVTPLPPDYFKRPAAPKAA